MKTKKLFFTFSAIILLINFINFIYATDTGIGIGSGINIDPNNLPTGHVTPFVWMCDNRIVIDDYTENGYNGLSLYERKNNYVFEGESLHWDILVMNLNGAVNVSRVVGTIGPEQGEGNDIKVECKRIIKASNEIPDSCNANVLGYKLTTFYPEIMDYYDCGFTVETPASMHGKYFITIEAKDRDGSSNIMDENEYFFLNPTIALSVYDNTGTNGGPGFKNLIPGRVSYSRTMNIENTAELGSGVMLDMFISGTDFSSSDKLSFCPEPKKLSLDKFRYYATNGAFSSKNNTDSDSEGYSLIPYSSDISGSKRIIRDKNCLSKYGYSNLADATRGASPSSTVVDADWNCGNALSPGSDMALIFKVETPGLCQGNFNEGNIYFWAEAI